MNSKRIIFAAGFASLASIAYLRSLQDDEALAFRVPDEQLQITDTAPLRRHTTALARQIAHLSPFDTAVGDVMGGVVPIGDVAGPERTKLRRLLERVVAPDFNPQEKAGIEWRKLLWSEVRWQEPDGRRKDPTPRSMDGYAARWFVDGSPFVVDGAWYPNGLVSISITISLTGNDRLHVRYPGMEEMDKPPFWVIVNEIDKIRLLAILTTVFRFPWQTVNDFVVTCSPSPTSPGHLRIDSSRRRQPSEPKDWFDDVPLHIDHGDPQKVSITVIYRDQ